MESTAGGSVSTVGRAKVSAVAVLRCSALALRASRAVIPLAGSGISGGSESVCNLGTGDNGAFASGNESTMLRLRAGSDAKTGAESIIAATIVEKNRYLIFFTFKNPKNFSTFADESAKTQKSASA